MKNLAITIAVALVACAIACGVVFVLSDDPALRAAARDGDAMAWLRLEFRLNDGEFASIQRLHEEFSIECSRHCAAIMAARERNAAAAEVAALEKYCVDAMGDHFRRVAALMPPEKGERYLAVVLPRLAGHAHQGAPNVRVAP